MPIYEYSCKKCNKNFELISSMADGDKTRQCPECGSTDVVKNISASAVKVRGGKSSLASAYGVTENCGGGSGFS